MKWLNLINRSDNLMTLVLILSCVCLLVTSGLAGDLTTDNLTVNEDGTVYGQLMVTQLVTLGSVPTNQVGYYTSNTDESGIITDESGNGNTGTVNGATWTADGKIEGAYDYDGVNDYVTLANESNFDFERTDSFSICAWVNPDVNGTARFIWSKEKATSPYEGIALHINANNELDFELINTVSVDWLVVSSSDTMSAGNWYHVAATYGGCSSVSCANLYINGVSQSFNLTNDSLTATILTDYDPQISARQGGNLPFNGLIDEVIIYSRELSSNDVYNLYLYNGTNFSTADTKFYDGVSYLAPLGDVDMGSYTNSP